MTIEFSEILDQSVPAIMAESDWFGEINSLSDSSKRLVLLGASANYNGQIRRVTSVAKGITDYGEGSPMACMIEAALRTKPKVEIYALSYAVGTGQATLACTFTGTSTAAGNVKVWVGGRLLTVGIANSTTAANVATAVIAQYAADAYNFPAALVAGGAGVVTANAVTLGISGNSIRIRIDCSGLPGISINLGGGALPIAEAPLASGATDTSPATSLATIEGDQRYHIFALGSEIAANIAACKTHMDSMSAAAVKKWCRTIVGWTGNSATAQTQADTSASMRIELVHHENSPRPQFEVSAAIGAIMAANDIRYSADDLDCSAWLMPQFDSTTWPTEAEMESDLDQGVTPLRCVRLGNKVLICRSVHTLHGAGLNGNYAMDTRILEISDYVKENIVAAFAYFKGAVFKTLSPAGLPGTLTLERATNILAGRLQLLDSEDYVQGTKTYCKAGLVVAEANGTNPDRVDCAYPLHPTRAAHVIAIKETYTF